jgi:hypothetical protein
VLFAFCTLTGFAKQIPGAHILWTTYEAERMHTNGVLMGPQYGPYKVETESSGQRCVKLTAKNKFVEFTAAAIANSLVIRYSLPDNKDGNGRTSTLGIYLNGKSIQEKKITSRLSWLYGKYPFKNDPDAGTPRHFYDEVRLTGINVKRGDVVRIQCNENKTDDAAYCIIDLADLENVAPPLKAPLNSISITDPIMGTTTGDDYTENLKKCISKAIKTGKSVWIPAGVFKITGDINLPENVTINGAGMWYSQLVGDDQLYADPNKRVRLIGRGSNIHLADFAITGSLSYRSDKEANDGIVGSYGVNSTILRIWIEHTKVGMWIENSSHLKITGCRMRNTMADGINFCVGMSQSTIENCTARGTGDDCFAIWPAVFSKQQFAPGHNLIKNCTAQLPFLANGAAIYGGDNNLIAYCSFVDISQGSAILVSTTFPTENAEKSINNNFTGTTTIDNCNIKTSGGFDHEWDWRAAIEICLDKRNINGLAIKNIHITNSLSNAVSVIAKPVNNQTGILTNAQLKNITISRYGMGVKNQHALFISDGADGYLNINKADILKIKNNSSKFKIVTVSH